MKERLAKGTRINMLLGGEAVVDEWMAEGGQGDVYTVTYNGGKKALKWYKPAGMGKDKQAFYENLKANVMNGSPSSEFLWPLDITGWRDGMFGYVMDLKPKGYYEVSDFMLTKVRFSSYRTMVDAALHIVSAYRMLHNKGYSYQDLNDGNFFINPQTGDVLICDNDNVAPDLTETGIIGKPRYMAPEIVTGKEKPNSLSDRFSMSVILFILFTLNHPLEGRRSLTPALTPDLQEKLYGTEALFIMDKENKDNAPDAVIHRNVLTVWPLLPDYMQSLFFRAFSQEALRNPNKRPKEVDWIKNLVRFQSDIVPCTCGNEVFRKEGKPCQCERCGNTIRISCRIALQDYSIPGIDGNILYRCQTGPCNVSEALEPVARVVASRTNADVLALKNLSGRNWDVETPSGKAKKILPEEGIPLKNGIKFTVNRGMDATKPIMIVEN